MKEMQGFVVVLVLICKLVIDKKGVTKEAMEIEGCLGTMVVM